MLDHYSLESLALEQQREIHEAIAMQRRYPHAHANGIRRVLALALAALAHRLDPYGVGQFLQAVPAPQR